MKKPLKTLCKILSFEDRTNTLTSLSLLQKVNMKKLVILLTALSINSFAQIRTGKGNGTFIPDITQSTKLFKAQATNSAFEKLLPEYTITDSTANQEYNKRTDKFDSIVSVSVRYSFTYAEKYDTNIEVVMSLQGKIKEMKYSFGTWPTFFVKTKQLTENGYHYDEATSRVAGGLNGSALKYYKTGNLCVVLPKAVHVFNIFRVR